MPTISDLLAVKELGLELRCGDPATPYAAVRSADAPGDRAWLAGGDLRLTETAYTERRPTPDPLFAEAPAAIAYALTPKRRELPPALLERARERGVALVTVPPTVNLRRVEQAALRLTADAARGSLQAAATLHRFLLAALESPKPERELLDRLHQLTAGTFVAVAPWGDLLARSGPAPWPGLGDPAAQLPAGRYRVAGRPALLLRVEHGGRLLALLVGLDAEPAELPLLETAVALLRIALLERSAEVRRDQAERAALLNAWLAGQEFELLAPRLWRARFDHDGRVLLVVAEAGGRSGAQRRARRGALEALRQAGDEFFADLGVGALSDQREDHCVWACQAPGGAAQLAGLAAALEAAAGVPVRLGASQPQPLAEPPAGAYFQAVLALRTITGESGTATFSDLDPVYWALRQQPPAHLRALRDGLVGAVKEADDDGRLWHTLQRYLAAPGSLGSLADELGIHVNTLRYRLKRIEELIGRPLGQPETIAQLYLADRIDRLLSDR